MKRVIFQVVVETLLRLEVGVGKDNFSPRAEYHPLDHLTKAEDERRFACLEVLVC